MYVRVAPAGLAGRLIASLIVCVLGACTRSGDPDSRVALAWSMEPSTPSTAADTIVRVTMHDARGEPVDGARLRLEAQMSHPGMAPVLEDLVGRGDGVYEARLRLSMAGDWVFVASGELKDGTRVGGSRDVRAGDRAR